MLDAAPLLALLPPEFTTGQARGVGLSDKVLARLPLDPRAYGWTLWPAIGLLPARVREDYGLRWGLREQLVARWLLAGWRAWNPLLPAWFRQMPQALAADRRVRR